MYETLPPNLKQPHLLPQKDSVSPEPYITNFLLTYEICGYVLPLLRRDTIFRDLGDVVGDQRGPDLPPAVDKERQEFPEGEEDPLAAELVLRDELLAHVGVVSQLRYDSQSISVL